MFAVPTIKDKEKKTLELSEEVKKKKKNQPKLRQLFLAHLPCSVFVFIFLSS